MMRSAVFFLVLPLAAETTFTRDVAPILFERCTGCHRAGEIAPMSFVTYKEVRPFAKAIREAVVTRRMPPWHADPHYGQFLNDARLPEREIATIRQWVEDGAPEGDPAAMPKPPVVAAGWRLGKPELVFEMIEPFVVKANSPDKNTGFKVPMNLDHDIWVQSVELRPGNRKAVHHSHVRVIPPSDALDTAAPRKPNPRAQYVFADAWGSHMKLDAPVFNDGCAIEGGGDSVSARLGIGSVLASFLPGREPDRWPAGYAKRIPAGSTLEFLLHYAGNLPQDETDRSYVGLVLAKEPSTEVLRHDMHNLWFNIPPGEPNQEVTACLTLDSDIRLLSFTPHMHYRGKDMRLEVTRPGGEPETLLFVPNYSFEWQTLYRYRDPIALPKGTLVKITAHFDNSANNRGNPDPKKQVRWGSPSEEEMMDGWLEFVK